MKRRAYDFKPGDVVSNKECPEFGNAIFLETHPVPERDESTVRMGDGSKAFWFTSNLVLVKR